ncbi:MAG TPA: hypothetical protein DEA90_04820 [Opitutae bacterium]|nr:hypothetical protein [Puniceicoccaceae bacterium]HBR93468.1 hypothetical protein [Opitutae bacterium]|tara:strand:- start:7495 stop:10374 length:2880 start_codon:yes stop_codon:yes gene_type:complete
MNSRTHADALHILRQQTRSRLLRGPLALALIGCLLTFAAVYALHPEPLSGEISFALFLLWLCGIGGSLLAGIVLYWRRRLSSTQVAQVIDSELHTKNRLEAASQFAGVDSPVATAQRTDASDYLAQHAPSRWPILTLLSLALGLLFFAYSMLTMVWIWNAAVSGFSVDDVPLEVLEEAPMAEIIWLEPKSEIKATQIEAIPLTAAVTTTHALTRPELYIQVNGSQVSVLALEVEQGEGSGELLWEPDLYLDMLAVEAFDLVSYYLQVSFAGFPSVDPATSAMQFIQIKPLREDVQLIHLQGEGGPLKEALQLLAKLKSAQLVLIKQNFLLVHAGLDTSEEIWVAENLRVQEDQSLLIEKTEQVVELLIAAAASTEIVDLLMQAKQAMELAAAKIESLENQAALEPQGKALSHIIEIEKLIQKVIIIADSSQPAAPKEDIDPFKDDQKYEMPPRTGGAAGQLEKLEKEQAELLAAIEGLNRPQTSHEPESPVTADSDAAELAKQQHTIEDALAQLLESGEFAGPVQDPLGRASQAAGDSALQLEAGDSVAARQPAAKTLMLIRDALGEMNQAGEKKTEQTLSEAAQKLDAAAADLSGSAGETPAPNAPGAPQSGEGTGPSRAAEAAAEKVAEVKHHLQTDAARQQMTGAKAMAETLAALAKSIEEEQILQDLEAIDTAAVGTGDASKTAAIQAAIEELATRVALEELGLRGGNQAFDKIAAELTSIQQGLKGLAQRERRKAAAGESSDSGGGSEETLMTEPNKGQRGQGEPTLANSNGSGSGATSESVEEAAQGNGSGSEGEPSEGATGSSSGRGAESGSGSGASSTKSDGQQDALLTELTRNLRMVEQLTSDAAVLAAIAELEQSIKFKESTTDGGGGGLAQEPRNVVEIVSSLEQPLNTVLVWLRAQSPSLNRGELLQLRTVDEVPREYRDAVQLYFEQLSLDYQSKQQRQQKEIPSK